ncbi:MAG: hypothetical protein H6819_10690 [Phycisphaerales bacterium]|nr:hypothetical protein [Phycisphaerales bacterium]MCB9854386.1 hypothetical protein [Phycisphaerales bacterium]MCB9863587.1 hypothetical protein [Phycisphaerales bacterium]
MSLSFGTHCDDFHLASRLFLKLDLTPERETVLHFFDSIRREFPAMTRMRRREDSGLVLEEDEIDHQTRRWLRIDEGSIRMGQHNPVTSEDAERLGATVLKMAPYHLTLGELDYDHLEVVLGFDLEYRGNHDQLIAETFFADSPIAGLLGHPDVFQTIDAQPFFGVALNEECDTQAYLEIKSRTSTFEVRTGGFDPQPLTVFLTLRRFWGVRGGETLEQVHHTLMSTAFDWAETRIVPHVVQPLAQAIASRP